MNTRYLSVTIAVFGLTLAAFAAPALGQEYHWTWMRGAEVIVGVPDTDGFARQQDKTGDATTVHGNDPNPHFNVNPPHNHIWGHYWEADAEITITIVDPFAPDFEDTAWADGSGNFRFDINPDDYDIVPGSQVTVTDGVTVKEHTVTSLEVTVVDPETDTVSGTADPGIEVVVFIHDGPWRLVDADAGTGVWTANFSEAVGEQPAYDLVPGTEGGANQRDADGDTTSVHWHVPNPRFSVVSQDNHIWGHDWAADAEITVTIDDGVSTEVFTTDSNQRGDFHLGLWPFDVQPGYEITVTDGIDTRTHTVRFLEVTEVDTEADTVSGEAEPGSEVEVHIFGGPTRWVIADVVTGEWIADFSEALGAQPWEQDWDIGSGTDGFARQEDEDGNATQVDWHVSNPRFSVAPQHNYIWGHDWAADAEITVTIDDGVSTEVFTTDSNQWGDFHRGLWPFDVQVGYEITVTDGIDTRTHTVRFLEVTEIDTAADTVSGKADPASDVGVRIDAPGGPSRWVIADEDNGIWIADFSVSDSWNQPWNIEPAAHGFAMVRDESGNKTQVDWHAPTPYFNWAWMKGADVVDQPGVYGKFGVPDEANTPGARQGSVSWTDEAGHFWLFGGAEIIDSDDGMIFIHFNDLWRYDPATGNWTWMKGSDEIDQPGEYGEIGVPDEANTPGARLFSVSWTDDAGDLWLFGGWGFDKDGNWGFLNDLWRYDPSTGNWTWMKGSDEIDQPGDYGELGVEAEGNTPGARAVSVTWTDAAGRLWLFGGVDEVDFDEDIVLYLNDLWRYDPDTGNWAWMKGSDVINQPGFYGEIGVPAEANTPGARHKCVSWIDDDGNLWLFGGGGLDKDGSDGELNDLWRYDPDTGDWTWMKGADEIEQPGEYGELGVEAAANTPGAREGSISWTDAAGQFWLFGGWGLDKDGIHDGLNDLWRYDPDTGNWTWMDGSGVGDQPGVYGELGVEAAANIPGARDGSVSWTDAAGRLWLFGGAGLDKDGSDGLLNDLWRGDIAPPLSPWIYDYTGYGTSDIAIFRESSGLWAVRGITRAYFGRDGDIPVPGDYTGDGTTNIAIFRESTGLWAVRGGPRFYFGTEGDIPVPGDYDASGTTDVGIYRPGSGLWAIRGVTRTYFGGETDIPVPGYYDGTKASPGIFRSASGLWAIQRITRTYFGSVQDEPVPGDYDGDGLWGPAIFRETSGLWAVRDGDRIYFGAVNDTPLPGGYRGDGVDYPGIFRETSGLWAIRGMTRTYFGTVGDVPVTR